MSNALLVTINIFNKYKVFQYLFYHFHPVNKSSDYKIDH